MNINAAVLNSLTDYERMILYYLEGKGFVSPTQIGKYLHPTQMYGSPWASPKCLHLVELGLLERNSRGHYALKEEVSHE